MEWRSYRRTGRVYAAQFEEPALIQEESGRVEAAPGDFLVVDDGLTQVRRYTESEFSECFSPSDLPVPLRSLPELSAVVASRVVALGPDADQDVCIRCGAHGQLRDFEGIRICGECELAIKAEREDRMHCVHDGAQMRKELIEGVIIDRCPECGGVWFDGGELEALSRILRLAADQGMPSPVASRLFESLTQRIAE